MSQAKEPFGDAGQIRQHEQLKGRSPIEKFKGIFSTQSINKIGTGSTTRKTIQKTYWSIEEQDDGFIEIQPLNKNYIPSGPKRSITKEEFLQKFSAEPEFYVNNVYPKMRELETNVVRGEEHRDKGELYSAEHEFDSALGIDEENVRANFGLGLTYFERGETTKANDIFKRLVNLEATFHQEHKHLFNDFGINLRKNNMYDQALEYYQKALELTRNDENLYLNIARALFEKGDMKGCAEHVKKCLEINPVHEEGKKFLEFLRTKRRVPEAETGDAQEDGAAPADPGPDAPDLSESKQGGEQPGTPKAGAGEGAAQPKEESERPAPKKIEL